MSESGTIDAGIEQLLIDVGGASQEVMDNAGDDFYPPPGPNKDNPATYSWVTKKPTLRKYLNKKDNREYSIINLQGQIVTPGEYEGRQVSIALFGNNSTHATLERSIARILGYEGTDVPGILRTLVGSFGGQLITMSHWFSPNKKNPDDPYTNYSVESLVPATQG